MKSKLLLVFAILAITTAQGQEDDPLPKGMSFGFNISEIQNDFGVGIDFASPYFLADRVGIRARANLRWFEHIDENLSSTWSPYGQFSLGVVSVAREFSDVLRLYGEGGVIGIVPDETFSSESFEFGGYGLFGFEFFVMPKLNYYMEIGGVGTGARADGVIGDPIFSNGLSVAAGFRVQL